VYLATLKNCHNRIGFSAELFYTPLITSAWQNRQFIVLHWPQTCYFADR